MITTAPTVIGRASSFETEVERVLRQIAVIPDTVHAVVTGATLTLVGEVDWDYQRQAAERAVRTLRPGFYTIANAITVQTEPSAAKVNHRIKTFLGLSAERVHVAVCGGAVILTGTVTSWGEKSQAAAAAWVSPHVQQVDDRIVVNAAGHGGAAESQAITPAGQSSIDRVHSDSHLVAQTPAGQPATSRKR
ncbi:BON domain-containing protein [Microbacterium sp. SL62]|uniref:BON domain-containing protein n=1 Tax=Microbacterium sp. SL62 TaxID=2995139 RepID=UPI002273713D|nr:BON domain-containing protein [Microbacterium sp. SL62]MCY1718613.1 BON domain-containing protein [Microbacterium sp. SL62]